MDKSQKQTKHNPRDSQLIPKQVPRNSPKWVPPPSETQEKETKKKKKKTQTWGKTPTKNTQYSHGFLLNFVDAQNAILRTFAFFTRRAASNPSINATGP